MRSLAAEADRPVRLGTILAAAGTRVHGLALLIFVLPEAVPLPLPSISIVLGVPLLLISGHLALFGDQAELPGRILATKLRPRVYSQAARILVPVLAWIEKYSTSRWLPVVRERFIGALCAYLSILLLLPLPLFNTPPALCMAAIAVGLMRRDGLFVAVGAGGTAALTAALLWGGERLLSTLLS